MEMETQDKINKRNAQEAAQRVREAVKQRVTDEANGLKESMDRLQAFINSTSYYAVTDDQKGLLKAQYVHMQAYYQTLKARLKAW